MSILGEATAHFFNVLTFVLFARILLSWFPLFHGTRLMGVIYAITEPILAPIRSMMQRSPLGGPNMVFDLSPLIAFLLLHLLRELILGFF